MTTTQGGGGPKPEQLVLGAGAMTMVALCFANGLQGGMASTWAQSTEALKHTFHVNDAVLGVVPFCVGLAGNIGAIPVAALSARHKRVAVLSGMFVIWGVLVALAGISPSFRLFGLAGAGFAVFGLFRVSAAFLEATDPAVYPLIADWWAVEDRGKKVSVFNTLSGVGGLLGLVGAGVLVDDVGWRWAFIIWLPLAFVGAALIRSRTEPPRGAQDAAYKERFERETSEEPDAEERAGLAAVAPGRWATVRMVSRLRSWRLAAIGVAVTGIMGSGLMSWGIAYFKRSFGLSGAQAGALSPVLGIGAIAGVLGGGYLADRYLARGVLRARLYVTAGGYAAAGVFSIMAFATTRLWLAAPLLGIAAGFAQLPLGPQFAMMMDVTPSELRPHASAALNVLQASGALGPLIVGIISTLLGENLRVALLCVSPFYLVGAVIVFAARRTYVADVALVVEDSAGS